MAMTIQERHLELLSEVKRFNDELLAVLRDASNNFISLPLYEALVKHCQKVIDIEGGGEA